MDWRGILLPAILLLSGCREIPPPVIVETEPTVESLITTFLDGGGTFRDIPFSEVIEASTGKRVLPIDPNDPVDARILGEIGRALDLTLARFNRPDSPANAEERINEVSSHFEESLRELLDRAPGFSCDYPRTREGHLQRSGYPDLRIVFEEADRVIYFDPKLVERGTLDSSLRTFYFTPRGETGKVLEDAHHLLVGIEHDGNTGNWEYLRWHLVDLARFRVRLKAEFQASNREIYTPELVISVGDR